MVNPKSGSRLTAILWFVAAGLALIAICIRFFNDGEMNWPLVGGGLFCLVMGIVALSQSRQPRPPV